MDGRWSLGRPPGVEQAALEPLGPSEKDGLEKEDVESVPGSSLSGVGRERPWSHCEGLEPGQRAGFWLRHGLYIEREEALRGAARDSSFSLSLELSIVQPGSLCQAQLGGGETQPGSLPSPSTWL